MTAPEAALPAHAAGDAWLAPAGPASPPPGQRDFRLLWAGGTANAFATNATTLALPLVAVTVLHSSPLLLGFLAAAIWVPWTLIGLPAGAWVDRLPKRPVMIASSLLSAALLISVPVAWSLRALTTGQVFVVALLIGGSSVFYLTAYNACIPLIVAKRDLTRANAKLQGGESAMQILGPGSGGSLSQAFGAINGLLVNAGVLILSAVCLAGIRQRPPEEDRTRPRAGVRAEMGEGARFVLRDPYFRAIVTYAAMANFALDGYQSIYVAFLIRSAHVSPAVVGILLAAGGAGGIVGALAVQPLARRFGSARGFLIGKLVITPFGLLMPLAHSGPGVLFFFAGLFAVDGSIVAGNITLDTFRQSYCPPDMLGRVVATTTLIKYSTIPLGAILGGVLGEVAGLRPTMWIMTGALVCFTALLLWGPLRAVRDFPDSPVTQGQG
ncbi:MAG TPA: MFS transporter [Trebonia sp.]|nr:MFS transporter [Trebonia sp.]